MTVSNLHRAWWRVQSVLAKGPSHWLAVSAFYTAQHLQRLRGDWRPDRLTEAAFLAHLRLDGDGAVVAQYFRARKQPVFFTYVEPPERAAHSRVRTMAVAEAVCRRTFTFRGQPSITFPGRVDWFHQPGDNVDWRWDLNRHGYFVALGRAFEWTGERRYLDTFRELLLDWMAHNPPDVDAPNWVSVLEPAYRLNVWAWMFHYFRAALDDAALLALLRGLWWHARFIAANLEWHVRNNHLLLQAKALAMCGLLFPEFEAARDWEVSGLRIVWQQVREQVHPDGVHAEQSTLYHRIIASELLELLALLQANQTPAPDDIHERFVRMLQFERAVAKPDGTAPLLGDSALDDSYVRYDALAMAEALGLLSLSSTAPGQPHPWEHGREAESCAFPQGGYFIQRCADRYLVFDCGPFGYPLAPGHGHADALSFELDLGGQTLLVDPGVYSYHLGARWRNYFRGTAAHNTIRVDGQDQSLLDGAMRVVRPARTTLHAWVSTDAYDLVDGAHDGYTRLARPVVHRRQILFVKPDYWIVFDQLLGQGRHEIELLFHFAPEAVVTPKANGQLASRSGEIGLWIAPLYRSAPARWSVVCGQEAPVQGWVSRYSGQKCAAPVALYLLSADLPLCLVTLLWPGVGDEVAPFEIETLEVHDDAGQTLAEPAISALRLITADWTDLIVLDRRKAPGPKYFSGQMSAGRFFWARGAQGDWRTHVWVGTSEGVDP